MQRRDGGVRSDVVARVSSEDFDVVLMDSQSPGLDGIDVAKGKICGSRVARTGRPPVVLIGLAATSQAAERERCLAAGMDGYLEYPLTLQTSARCSALPETPAGTRIIATRQAMTTEVPAPGLPPPLQSGDILRTSHLPRQPFCWLALLNLALTSPGFAADAPAPDPGWRRQVHRQ